MKLTIEKDNFFPSKPWYIRVNDVRQDGKKISYRHGGFKTKKSAKQLIEDTVGLKYLV